VTWWIRRVVASSTAATNRTHANFPQVTCRRRRTATTTCSRKDSCPLLLCPHYSCGVVSDNDFLSKRKANSSTIRSGENSPSIIRSDGHPRAPRAQWKTERYPKGGTLVSWMCPARYCRGAYVKKLQKTIGQTILKNPSYDSCWRVTLISSTRVPTYYVPVLLNATI
jgi:hypothetical protein